MGGDDRRAMVVAGGCMLIKGGIVVGGTGGMGWELVWALETKVVQGGLGALPRSPVIRDCRGRKPAGNINPASIGTGVGSEGASIGSVGDPKSIFSNLIHCPSTF